MLSCKTIQICSSCKSTQYPNTLDKLYITISQQFLDKAGQIIIVLFAFTELSFLPNRNALTEQLLAVDPSYCCLYSSKQAIDCFVLLRASAPLPCFFSHLERSVEQILAADLSAPTVGAGKLLIATSMDNLKSPTNTTIIARL